MTETADLAAMLQELRVAEEELRAQNEALLAAQTTLELERRRYADLFEAGPDAFLVTDLNGKILEASFRRRCSRASWCSENAGRFARS